jgi:hypothetical protein
MCVRFVSACSSNTQLKLADWCVSPSGFAVPNWIQVSGAYRPRQRVYQPFGLENTRVLLHVVGQRPISRKDAKNGGGTCQPRFGGFRGLWVEPGLASDGRFCVWRGPM